jgi:hypothetical protein
MRALWTSREHAERASELLTGVEDRPDKRGTDFWVDLARAHAAVAVALEATEEETEDEE